MIKYTCDCVKKSEFVQCKEAKASKTNLKCRPVKRWRSFRPTTVKDT